MEFSETVLASSLDVEEISIHNNNGKVFTFSAQSSATASADGTSIVMNIGKLPLGDLNKIKADTALCVSKGSCSISMTADAIVDMALLPNK
eukprot:UC1_evm1s1648